MTRTASDPRDEAEAALMAAVDEYGLDCADRTNLPYKYGTVGSRKDSDEWAAVRAAYRQAVIAELEAIADEDDGGHVYESAHRRLAELRRAP